MKLTVFALYGRNSIVRAQALEHRLVQLCRVVLHVASSWTRDQTHGPCISSPMFGFQSENGMSFREKEKGGFVLGRISLIYTVRWDDAPSEFDAGSIPSGGPGLLRSTAMEEDCERPCLRLVRRENQGSVRIMESAGISAKATAAPVSLPARQEGGKGRASGESNSQEKQRPAKAEELSCALNPGEQVSCARIPSGGASLRASPAKRDTSLVRQRLGPRLGPGTREAERHVGSRLPAGVKPTPLIGSCGEQVLLFPAVQVKNSSLIAEHGP
ncbi:hypothetical protein MJT46_003502 [Ovis ammon polii x Ovis aries]|nr:hypothetical protein MJT46_003502 [Ovis ammon polii x Ovis aries]